VASAEPAKAPGQPPQSKRSKEDYEKRFGWGPDGLERIPPEDPESQPDYFDEEG
jgi:hypothetical protein